MKQCSKVIYTLNTIATATNGVYPFLQDKLQRVVQIKQEARQMVGNDTGHKIAWSSGLNDDDLNDHLVWPQVYSDSTGVEPARGEGPLYTDHEGGDEEAHGDTADASRARCFCVFYIGSSFRCTQRGAALHQVQWTPSCAVFQLAPPLGYKILKKRL